MTGKRIGRILWCLLAGLFLFSFVLGRYDVPLIEVVKILLSRIVPLQKTWTDKSAILF